jgi:putative ABC transport system permease protein
LEAILQESSLIKYGSLETVRFLTIGYQERVANTAIRGVYPIYGEMRNEIPVEGRWISPEDSLERRRVVFLGDRLKDQLFSGRPAIGETVNIMGVRFTVIGVMDRKIQLSNHFTSDDRSAFIPYTTAGDLWNNRYASALVLTPINGQFEEKAIDQARFALSKRQRFSPSDKRALITYGAQETKPIIDGLTIGLQVLLMFIGGLTLGIGGVGVMNIMLVSVDERIREIGLRRALGARRIHIFSQFLAEALALTILGGILGLMVAHLVASLAGTLPLLGPLYKDTSGKADIHLVISWSTASLSAFILILVGITSGMVPALRASRLDPADALRYE